MTIKNWSIYGHHAIGIEAHQDDNGKTFHGAFTIILDDGKPLDKDQEKQHGITIFSDIVTDSAITAIQYTASLMGQVFSRLIKDSLEFDSKGELVKKYDLVKLMDKFEKKQKAKKRTNLIH